MFYARAFEPPNLRPLPMPTCIVVQVAVYKIYSYVLAHKSSYKDTIKTVFAKHPDFSYWLVRVNSFSGLFVSYLSVIGSGISRFVGHIYIYVARVSIT